MELVVARDRKDGEILSFFVRDLNVNSNDGWFKKILKTIHCIKRTPRKYLMLEIFAIEVVKEPYGKWYFCTVYAGIRPATIWHKGSEWEKL